MSYKCNQSQQTKSICYTQYFIDFFFFLYRLLLIFVMKFYGLTFLTLYSNG